MMSQLVMMSQLIMMSQLVLVCPVLLQVDFDLLAENLVQLERRCKASWENLKLVAKHESKAVLKNKMTEFLRDCTQRVKILKVVHRRVINR